MTSQHSGVDGVVVDGVDVDGVVAVVMGSDSDLPVMSPAIEILNELGIECEAGVVSAHRTPERMVEWARTARDRGVRVVIAGAGGAAHLPGMIASLTTLPVIGVPVARPRLDGLDSLLSIVQMPDGIPVATVAIDSGRNAGLLAARILAIGDRDLTGRLERYRDTLAQRASDGDARVRSAHPYLDRR